MPINPKRETALRLLAATGMWRSNYEPPLVRLLWRCGVEVPPPHFMSFRNNAVIFGTAFAIVFSVVRRLIEGPDNSRSLVAGLLELVVLGALFGLLMAGIIERAKRKYRLPTWREL